jgi:hypothetical protein
MADFCENPFSYVLTDLMPDPAGREVIVRYWPKSKPIPKGWKRHDGLDGTHHGKYSTFIVPDSDKGSSA